MVHPIVDPTKFWEGVEDAHIRPWKPRPKFVTTSGDFSTENTCKCVGGRSSALDPAGGAYSAPPNLLSGFGGWGEEGDYGWKDRGRGEMNNKGEGEGGSRRGNSGNGDGKGEGKGNGSGPYQVREEIDAPCFLP